MLYFAVLKVHTMKNFAAVLRAAKIIFHFLSSTSRSTAWPLYFKFASYAYAHTHTTHTHTSMGRCIRTHASYIFDITTTHIGDLTDVLQHISTMLPHSPLLAVGASMGRYT